MTGSTHNVTAHQNGPDGKALFRSPTISGGTVGVNGTQYLSAGDYTFFCTVHPTHDAGDPARDRRTARLRPGPPQLLPSAARRSPRSSRRACWSRINASTKVDGAALIAKLGKATIGKANGVSLAAGQQVDA